MNGCCYVISLDIYFDSIIYSNKKLPEFENELFSVGTFETKRKRREILDRGSVSLKSVERRKNLMKASNGFQKLNHNPLLKIF